MGFSANFGYWAVGCYFVGLLIAKYRLLKFGYAGTGLGRVWGELVGFGYNSRTYFWLIFVSLRHLLSLMD